MGNQMTPGPLEKKEKSAKKERTKKEKASRSKKTQNKAKSAKQTMLLLKCPLCLDEMKKKAVVSTKCGHVFCRKCLQKALISNPTCPMCRKRILGPLGYHPLFLTANFED